MQKFLLTVDRLSTFVGKIFSWCIVGLTLLITWEIFSRYALNTPHDWAFDGMIQLYGMLFMMSGAYTLSKNNMVRGDVLYGFFPPRLQASLDLTLYFVFFLPGVDRPHLGRVPVFPRILGDPGAFGHHRQRPPGLPVQGHHPDRRGVSAPAGDRRDHPLRPLPEGRPVALAAAGCGGGGCGEAEGADERQGRGHRQAR